MSFKEVSTDSKWQVRKRHDFEVLTLKFMD
jgi:hypothetical protein